VKEGGSNGVSAKTLMVKERGRKVKYNELDSGPGERQKNQVAKIKDGFCKKAGRL